MIKKELKKTNFLLKLEALDRRLPFNHPKRLEIEEDLAKQKAGFNGEKAVNYYLTFLDNKKYYLLFGLRFKDSNSRYFQIDTLVLSTKFVSILESKNIAGHLYFDQHFHQLIRTLDSETSNFSDPLLQVQRHTRQLRSLLNVLKYQDIPIHPFVVISSPSSIIDTHPNDRMKLRNVIHAGAIPTKLHQLENYYQEEILTKRQLNSMVRRLLKLDEPYNPNILEHYKISPQDIINGIYCEQCAPITLQRIRGTWKCSSCNKSNRDAHIRALKDYYLIFGPTITNQQMRHFLKLKSEKVARELLKSLCKESFGVNRYKYYTLPFTEEDFE